jgi:DNA-binding NarL/FixJ family response regulator
MGKIRILVAARSLLVAEAMAALFEEFAMDADITIARSAEDVVDLARSEQPMLVVLDAWIGGDPVTTVRNIAALAPTSKVYVIATKYDRHLEERLLRAGAAGFQETVDLPDAVHTILSESGLAS